MSAQVEGELDEGMLELLRRLEDAHPDRGFILVSVGGIEGREHLLTYSNMETRTVTQIASLIVNATEEAEEAPPKSKRH